MNLAERIQAALAHADLSQAELARRIGVSRATVNAWATGATQELKGETLLSASLELGVNAMWLLSGKGVMHNHTVRQTSPTYNAPRQVPVVSWTTAGQWGEVVDPYPPGQGDEFVEITGRAGWRSFALRVVGDSMEPTIPDGAIAIVDPDMSAQNGQVVLAKRVHDQLATMKRLQYDGAVPYLKPDKPRYPILPMTDDTRIIGVVVQAHLDLLR